MRDRMPHDTIRPVSHYAGTKKVDLGFVGSCMVHKGDMQILAKMLRNLEALLRNQFGQGFRSHIDLKEPVPEDVKVVGFDENPMFQLHDPPITGVRYPVEEMCHQATELLIARVTDQAVNGVQEIVLPTQIIHRRSCRLVSETFN